jgi:uncharacterized RDD family membrane protein YckC
MGPRTPATLAGAPREPRVVDDTGRAPAGTPAPVGGRFAAALVDWLLVALVGFVLLAGLPQLVFAASGRETEAGMPGVSLVPVVLAVFVTVYFGVAWAGPGRTVGLFVFSLRLVERGSGSPPAAWRALARAGLTLATLASALAVVLLAGDPAATLAGAGAGVALALGGHLWALVDREGRSLQDRALGLAVEQFPEPSARPAGRTP